MNEQRLPQLVRNLYRIVGELEAMFPGRHFTPDGHMVGSLGESLAAYHYGLELVAASTCGHDAIWKGRRVEIKATQGTRVSLRSEAEHLLVLQLDEQGGFDEVYNGPGGPVWSLVSHKALPANGQHQVSTSRLRTMMRGVSASAAIPRVNASRGPAVTTSADETAP
jgi:hypothetical protein